MMEPWMMVGFSEAITIITDNLICLTALDRKRFRCGSHSTYYLFPIPNLQLKTVEALYGGWWSQTRVPYRYEWHHRRHHHCKIWNFYNVVNLSLAFPFFNGKFVPCELLRKGITDRMCNFTPEKEYEAVDIWCSPKTKFLMGFWSSYPPYQLPKIVDRKKWW